MKCNIFRKILDFLDPPLHVPRPSHLHRSMGRTVLLASFTKQTTWSLRSCRIPGCPPIRVPLRCMYYCIIFFFFLLFTLLGWAKFPSFRLSWHLGRFMGVAIHMPVGMACRSRILLFFRPWRSHEKTLYKNESKGSCFLFFFLYFFYFS